MNDYHDIFLLSASLIEYRRVGRTLLMMDSKFKERNREQAWSMKQPQGFLAEC
ncbi:protein of unknown function [Pseudodesulfovibrio piezophilus C1TLV30]|uniref:Uncharacterized protein n=1 Tax=Pseudodesulfovibrio piezophilus (strain DSM 21447 / JCM 15486 / C1TLV30) TaxID=1322246 RepID=M1WRD0_PSEP2|nr:protein of unknown function [Pseudodesulfovibrio piezophilus C1TLV30]